MIIINGTQYNTNADAARALGVSTKTLRKYIDSGVLSKPPTVNQGLRVHEVFPEDYIQRAQAQIDSHRQDRRSS